MKKKFLNKFNSLEMTLQFYVIVLEAIIVIIAIFYSCLYPVIVYKNKEFIYDNLKIDVDLIDDGNVNVENNYPFEFMIIKGDVNPEITRSKNLNIHLSSELQDNILKLPYTPSFSFTELRDENKEKIYVCTVKKDNIRYCTLTSAIINEHLNIYKDDIYLIFFAAIIFFSFFLIVLRWLNKLTKSVNKLNGFLLSYSNDYKDAPTSTKEINSLFANFEKYRKNLVEKDTEKQVLFQNISHELKTPLTTIKMYSEALHDGIYSEENVQETSNIIIKETDRLLEKVSKIIQINKLAYLESLNKGVKNIDRVSISDVLFEVMNNYNVIAPDIKFNVNLDNITYRGTKDVWKTVLENVFDNNIRHHAKQIEITLNESYMIIENDGEKIPEDLLINIFEPFTKGVNGNYGLGLSIIKKSLTMYNYSIKIENSKKGVTYFITDNK